MTIVRITATGAIGINKDLSSHELPNNAWSDGNNIRFLDSYAGVCYGYGSPYGAPTAAPLHLLFCKVASGGYWLYATATKIYSMTVTAGAAVDTNITRQTAGVDVNYTNVANAITSTLHGGIPIINNGTDAPQQWLLTGKCTDLSNWPASTTCKSMRSVKNYLVALNVTKSGTSYPYMVKWSHPSDPGAVPSSWAQTDATKDAGEYDLSEGYDQIVDGLQLRSSLIIYKENSTWRMDYTGGTFVFSFQKILGNSGLMGRNCAVELDGMHFCLTKSDLIVHDGQTATPVLDKMSRRDLFTKIEQTATDKCFVFKNPFFNEIYVCFPSLGNTVPNRAMVWNYVDKTVSYRDIPSLNHASTGNIDMTLLESWASDSEAWVSDLTLWNSPALTPDSTRVLMAGNGTKLYMLDSQASFDGTQPVAYMERRGLSFTQPEAIKLIRSVRPRITGQTGGTVNVYVGYADTPYADPTYGDAIPFTIGTTLSCDTLTSGRYLALKFASGTAYQWRLDSLDVDVVQAGAW